MVKRTKKPSKYYPSADQPERLAERIMKVLLVELEHVLTQRPTNELAPRPTLAQCYVAIIKALPGSETWKEEGFSAAVSKLAFAYQDLHKQRTRRKEAAALLKAKRKNLSTGKDTDVHG